MFARHTPTRMRGSGVVQSLKSLASKLHPQLPLSPKESQRLLTALTSSFRQKLDEAHPRQAHDEDAAPKLASGNSLKTGSHALHTSSVAFADRHLASVLTHPLLTQGDRAKKPTLNLESAKRELEQNPDRDPISLLEEYHQQGAATLLIADLCLRNFRESLLPLSTDDRRTKVEKHSAGKRTLQWLWMSELFQTDEFVTNRRLMTVLVAMIVEEGLEQHLWSWLALDMKLGTMQKIPDRYAYRWKDFMTRCLVLPRWHDENPAGLNDALDVFFKAVDLHQQIAQESTTNLLPLSATITSINNRIFTTGQWKRQWDVTRYDRYIESMDLLSTGQLNDFRKAQLMLTHPRHPSPIPMLELLKAGFLTRSTSQKAQTWNSFRHETGRPETHSRAKFHKYSLLMEIARQLQDLGHTEDLDWIVLQTRSMYPEYAQYIDADLNRKGPPRRRPSASENFSEFHPALASLAKLGSE